MLIYSLDESLPPFQEYGTLNINFDHAFLCLVFLSFIAQVLLQDKEYVYFIFKNAVNGMFLN